MSPTAVTPDQFSTFGELLRHLRRQARLTQRELAIAVGYSDTQISRMEQNQRVPDPATITALFVPALYIEEEPKWIARLMELAKAAQVNGESETEVTAGFPTGTVTFLFTDIEGSTKLARQYPDAMLALLTRHHEILRQCIQARNGFVFQVVGDSFAAAFHSASEAFNSALDAQRLLHNEAWSPAPIKVRMGIHTGTAHLQDASQVLRYSGYATLAITQRVMSAGHGGQILVSQSTYELARDMLPERAQLVDLGKHRLKDALRAEHIYQLTTRDLPSEFPPLNTTKLFNHNLPAQLTSFIGREKEIAEIKEAIKKHRLVTLTGPGGTGKTRLGLQVIIDLLDEFKDGVYFVNLAPISDPNLVASTIAQTLNVKEAAGRPLLESLNDYLHSKHFLLCLDNFEQVVSAALLVTELLAACSQLKVLVTSREVLHLQGEHEFCVPPLASPDPKNLPSLERLSAYEGVELFIQRALAVKHDFAATAENASAIAEICYRLDGLPLAIELAAARIKLFPPQVLLARLVESPLRLLTAGARDLPARQQTLRNAVAWSYNLLDENEKTLFRRLAVFVSGFTMEAAQAVCNAARDLGKDVLEGVASLVDKSLLRQVEGVEGTPRFGMLVTIREYALERLAACRETEAIRWRHAEYFLWLAEQAEPELKRLEQKTWLERLEIEHDNLRAALQWSQVTANGPELGLRLAGALFWFWYVQGYWSEGRQWLAGVLARTNGAPPAVRAKALCGAGALAFYQGDYIVAHAQLEDSIMIFREVGDKHGLALSLGYLGDVASFQGDYARALSLLEEGMATFQEVGDRWGIAIWLKDLGLIAFYQGDDARATVLLEKSVMIFREVGDEQAAARSLLGLGAVVLHQGDDARAKALYEESLMLCEALGHKRGTALSLHCLATVARHQGHNGQATELCQASLMMNRELGDKLGIVLCLEEMAGVAGAQGKTRRAARLFGASQALYGAFGVGQWSYSRADRLEYDRIISDVRAQLDEETFGAAWEEGKKMTLEQAVEYALKENHE